MCKINQCCQETAADILTKFSFVKNDEDFDNIWEDVYKQYNLKTDPFTFLPITMKEYIKSNEEYQKQKYEEYYE